MIKPVTDSRLVQPSEEGYALLWVIFMLAVFTIAIGVAAPKVKQDIQRDRDIETINRGKQYIRAIQMYYAKFKHYPPNLDALVQTDNIRFLRKKYADPTTGKDEWNLILFGQANTSTATNLLGQPPTGSGSTVAGIGSGSQTFGGAGIIGVSPNSPKQSILVYKEKSHYNEWEFVYLVFGSNSSASGNGINNSGTGSSNSVYGFGSPGYGSSSNNQSSSPNGNLPSTSSGSGSDNSGSGSNNDQIYSPNGNLPAPPSPSN